MSIGLQGENLIFVISQPRAGSTMLQRILGSHPEIHTTTEPWIMLHPAYALGPHYYQAEYNTLWAWVNMGKFLETLPDGKKSYLEAIRHMAVYLYESAMADYSAKHYFLDKTPRYYFIISELAQIFPEARYIILLRNPLAVLCSIINSWIFKTWRKGNWFSMCEFRHDLLQAPLLLLEGIKTLDGKITVVRYENVIQYPDEEILRVCHQLKIDFKPEIINYGRQNLPRWQIGDQDNVYQNERPSTAYLDKWVQSLAHPQIWRLANDYLHWLGPDIIEQMGYSYEELEQILKAYRPGKVRTKFTFPLSWLLRGEKVFKTIENARSFRSKTIREKAQTVKRVFSHRFGPH